MSEPSVQLDRIEQLLREGNALRSQAILLQQEALATQKALIEEQRSNLERAAQVNEGALAIQKRARGALAIVLPLILVLIGYLSYILFVRIGA